MWDIPRYTSRKWAFNDLSQGLLEAARAGTRAEVGVGAQASRTTLKIRCKLPLEYIRTSLGAARDFDPGNLASYLKNFDLGDREESGGAMKKRSQQG